jgi:uncharacterized protein YciI
MFVCVTTYRGPLPVDDPILPQHWAFLDRELAAGRLIASGPQVPRIGGVFILRVDDEAEARALMQRDPLVAQCRVEFQLIQFQPTRAMLPDLVESPAKE